jgi:hypothetical protein
MNKTLAIVSLLAVLIAGLCFEVAAAWDKMEIRGLVP